MSAKRRGLLWAGGLAAAATVAAVACHMRATARLVLDLDPAVVLTLGDNQYENGTLAKFRRSYEQSWGRLRSRTRPAPGNHDYRTAGAAGYFDYFGAAAGPRSTGFYSFDVGAWHLIALNSECAHIGGCGKGSLQERWLRADLAAHPAGCTLAYWHKPRFSSGWHGSDATYTDFWRALYEAGADVVLVGHDHDYERFAPQTPDARPDPARGIRQFVVGTGGKTHDGFRTVEPNSQVRTPAPSACCASPSARPATAGASCPSRAGPSPTPATAPATSLSWEIPDPPAARRPGLDGGQPLAVSGRCRGRRPRRARSRRRRPRSGRGRAGRAWSGRSRRAT
jgi:Calcineurin-like phosphoesterase